MNRGILDRDQGFDGGGSGSSTSSQPRRRKASRASTAGVAITEADDAAVFQETANDAPDPDVLRQAGNARPQAADASDDQLDPHAGPGGLVELVDHRGVEQGVGLDPDPGRFAGTGKLDLGVDRFDQTPPKRQRGDAEFLEPSGLA